MTGTIFIILLRSQFKNLYARKIAYLFTPVMAGYLSLCLSLNSYWFLFISVICYFFVVDAIAIPGEGLIVDISNFYPTPKRISKVYLGYIKYRVFNGFILNFLPAILVFVVVSSMVMEEIRQMRLDISLLVFCLGWIAYVVSSIPMLILAFRKKAFYQLYSLFAFPFYSIGIIIQLEINWKLFVMRDYLVFVWVTIGVVFITMGISFMKFLKNEVLYPEKKNSKLGFYK